MKSVQTVNISYKYYGIDLKMKSLSAVLRLKIKEIIKFEAKY